MFLAERHVRFLLPTYRKRPRCAASLFFRAFDKPLLDLDVDLMKPFLRAVGSLPITSNIGLEFCDPLLGTAQLVGKLLSHIKRMLTICFGHSGCLVKQPQNGLSRGIKLIAFPGPGGARCARKRDDRL